MTMEGVDLISLESNLHRYHPVIISQIINMIEADNFLSLPDFRISQERPPEHVVRRDPRIGKCVHSLYK